MKNTWIARMGLLSLVTVPLLVGCSSAGNGDDAQSEESDVVAMDGKTTTLPPPADPNARLYFGSPAYDLHTDDVPLTYRVFVAKGGNEFKVGAAAWADDGSGIDATRTVGFKLYYLAKVHGKNKWVLAAPSVDGVSGVATLRYTAKTTRTYMMEVTGGPLPMQTRSDLACAGGDDSACAPAGQPGDMCGGIAGFRCDVGLFCKFADGVCGAGDQSGSCTIEPHICPKLYMPVCGCDGATYGNSCEASSAGTSVSHQGACDCDATVWNDQYLSADLLAANTWQSADQQYTYTFTADGRFTAVFDPTCRHVPPYCGQASQEHTGAWALDPKGPVVLTNDYDGSTTAFSLQSNCYRTERLYGNDFGTQISLAPLPAAQ